MTPELIVGLAAMTFASRALALAYLPALPERLAVLLDRMPPALFAGLAAISLINPEGAVVDTPILAAAGGALLASPRRSLPLCLVAGLAAYGIVAVLSG
jgi:branched-subunit amino acid transport protein